MTFNGDNYTDPQEVVDNFATVLSDAFTSVSDFIDLQTFLDFTSFKLHAIEEYKS